MSRRWRPAPSSQASPRPPRQGGTAAHRDVGHWVRRGRCCCPGQCKGDTWEGQHASRLPGWLQRAQQDSLAQASLRGSATAPHSSPAWPPLPPTASSVLMLAVWMSTLPALISSLPQPQLLDSTAPVLMLEPGSNGTQSSPVFKSICLTVTSSGLFDNSLPHSFLWNHIPCRNSCAYTTTCWR